MRKYILSILLMCFYLTLTNFCYAQTAIVAADNFTGTSNVAIPLLNIKSGSLSIPINLTYSGGGVKVKDVEGTAGIGWNVSAGGEIRRELRDLPDDGKMDGISSGQPRLGWLYNTNGAKIQSLNFANDNNPATCTDEQTDINFLNSNFGDLSDTEPDIFVVNAPGLSCKLVFDKDRIIRTIPYQDIRVTYELETNATPQQSKYGRIKSFTITNNQGVKYNFADIEIAYKTTKTSNDPNTISYFKRQFDQYKNEVQYINAWKLTSITDINQNFIAFLYTNSGYVYKNKRISLATGNSTSPFYPYTIRMQSQYLVLSRIYFQDLYSLVSTEKEFNFFYKQAYPSNKTVIDSISGFGKTIRFSYLATNKRAFLANIISNTGDKYSFDYYKNKDGLLLLPDSNSRAIDAWGYYNGKTTNTTLIPQLYINPSNTSIERYRYDHPGNNASSFPYILAGADRSVNADSILIGSLKSVNYIHGGSTSLIYEPNDYYDPTAGAIIKGGGIRLKQVINFDGNAANNNIKDYSYINPVIGASSGKAVSLPLLAFTNSYAANVGTVAEKWGYATTRMEESLSPEEDYVAYSHVKITQNGIGSSLYEYSLPATHWDNNAAPDWLPTQVNIGRLSCISAGFLVQQKNTYPFVPHLNFDFERGLPLKSTLYNNNSAKVSETDYSYQRTNAPFIIQAVKFDMNGAAMSYAKYPIFANTGNLLVQENRKDYDTNTGQYQQTVSANQYNGNSHKLQTLQTTTTADGTIFKTYTNYTKDYLVNATGNENAVALYNLQLQNVNLPVETYKQIQKDGITRTILGNLQTFKPITINYKPMNVTSQTLGFSSGNGLTNFIPATISGNNFIYDNNYRVLATNVVHDYKGMAISVENSAKQVQTVLTDYNINQPVVSITNARADEIAFNDFDVDELNVGFTYNYETVVKNTTSRTGTYAVSITPSSVFQKSINKNLTAKNYIFSVWHKENSGSLTLILTNSNNVSYSYVIPLTSTYGTWKYNRIRVPVTDMTATFTAKIQSSNIGLIDDMLFYPEQADITIYSYNQATANKLTETNGNGITTYYTYDAKGRLSKTLDQDKNIVAKRSYGTKEEMPRFSASITIDKSDPISYNTPIRFQGYGSGGLDNSGVKYTWDFGDGTPVISTYAEYGSNYHQYTQAGTYTATLTKTSPLYGTASAAKTITITNTSQEKVTVSYYELSQGNGTLEGLKFYKNGVFVRNMNKIDFETGNNKIDQGVYQIQVEVSGNAYDRVYYPNGFKAVFYEAHDYVTPATIDCTIAKKGTGIRTHYLSIDLNGKKYLVIYPSQSLCSVPIE